MVREERRAGVQARRGQRAEERLLDLLLPPPPRRAAGDGRGRATPSRGLVRARRETLRAQAARRRARRAHGRDRGRRERPVPSFEIFTPQGIEEMDINLHRTCCPACFGGAEATRTHDRRRGARASCEQEEAAKLIDPDQVHARGDRARRAAGHHLHRRDRQDRRPRGRLTAPTSRARACSATCCRSSRARPSHTKYGMVRTDHILFIAAGAFHVVQAVRPDPRAAGALPDPRRARRARPRTTSCASSPSRRTRSSKQYAALLATEGVELDFTDDAIDAIAELAAEVNDAPRTSAPAGCTRSWSGCSTRSRSTAPEHGRGSRSSIDAAYVRATLADIVEDQDLSRYVL